MSNCNNYADGFRVGKSQCYSLLISMLVLLYLYAMPVSAELLDFCGGDCEFCRSQEYKDSCPITAPVYDKTEGEYGWNTYSTVPVFGCSIRVCHTCSEGQYYSKGACVSSCPLGTKPDASGKACEAEVNADAPKTCSPISLDAGNKSLVENDFYSTNGLSFSRYFNYLAKTQVSRLNYYDQWSMDFHQKLQLDHVHNASPTMKDFTRVMFVDKGLRRYGFYINNATGVVTKNDKLNTVLLTVTTSVSTGPTLYTFTYTDGTKYVFNTNGNIASISNPFGQKITISNTYTNSVMTKKTVKNTYGQSLVFNYTSPYNFTMTDPDGYLYRYVFDSPEVSSPKLTVTLPDATVIRYTHQNKKGTMCSSGVCGVTGSLAGDGALMSIDYNGVRYLTYRYNSAGRAIHSHQGTANAESKDIVYDLSVANKTRTTVTNRAGKVAVLTFDKHATNYRLVSNISNTASVNCLATNSYYNYDANGFQKTFTDKNNNATETLRNSRGLITTERTALRWVNGVNSTLAETASSQKTVTAWHASLALPLSRTYYGWNGSAYQAYKKEVFTYTANNRIATFTLTDLTTIEQPYATNGRSHRWNYSYQYYDSAQTKLLQQTIDGPRNDVNDIVTYNFDASGNVTGIVNALGHATLFSDYNARGLVGNITDANNNVTSITYTSRGLPDKLTVNDTATIDYDYFGNGLVKKVTLADGSWLAYTYNDARHLIRIDNNLGEKIEFTPSILDGEWKVEVVKNANNDIVRQRQRVFDELGRVMTLQGQNGQLWKYGYDRNDNLKTENDALQQLTTYNYDAQNRISETLDAEQNAKAEPVDKHAIAFTYDVQGNLDSVTDQRGNTTRYLYDGFGELIQQTSPDTGIAVFSYDEAGNLTGSVDARAVNTAYQYDVLNRLTSVLYVGNPAEDITYSYDSTVNGNKGAGRLTGYIDNNGTTTLAYDNWGLHETEFCLPGLQCYSTQFIHNGAGQLSSLVYPSGNSVIYAYDTSGRVNAVSYQEAGEPLQNIASLIEYHAFGAMKKITYGNGVALDITNDVDGRIDTLTAIGAHTIYNKDYSHTVTNNIASITDAENGQNTRTYTYDKLSRLQTASKGTVDPVISSYAYDEVGNRTARQVTGSANTVIKDETLDYPADSNRLQSVSDSISGVVKTYTYDAAGNITVQAKNNGNNTTFTYSNGNRMTVTDVANGSITSYVYNSLGQRVVKIPDGDFSKAAYYHYSPTGQLLAEHNMASRHLLVENIYANGILLARMDARDGDIDNDGWTDSDEESCSTDMYNSLSVPVDNDADSQCDFTDNDDDNDGFMDIADNCPLSGNTLQIDSDLDGVGDDCDVYPNDPLQF